jgi:ABC-type nitrate/sulfonate/bicarbonate transport system permease component
MNALTALEGRSASPKHQRTEAGEEANRDVSRRRLERGVRIASIGVLLGGWELVSWSNANVFHRFNPLLFPSLEAIALQGWEMLTSGELLVDTWASLARIFQGFSIAAFLGVLFGALVGRIRLCEAAIDPIISILRPIPPLAFLPMLVLWFGIGEMSKIAFIAYAAFFPIFTTTVEGIKYVEPVLLRAAASLGASQRDIFKHVVLPAALPSILTGLRLGFSLSCFVIVAAEFIASNSGLGFLINEGRTFFLVPRMLVAAAMVGLLGFTFNVLLKKLEDRVLRWRLDSRG